jgi:hypothetical protein
MPELKNPRFEKFAQVFFKTGNATAAYKDIGGSAKHCDRSGWRMAKNIEIASRVKELKLQASNEATLSRQKFVENLIEMITSPPSAASLDNPLCEARYVGKDAIKVAQFPERTRCMELLAKTLGWLAPDKLSITIDPLQSLLDEIRARRLEQPSIKQLPSP